MNIYKKAANGFKWTLFSKGLKAINGFIIILFLTYFLTTEDIGTISILMVIYGLSDTLVQFGISQSIISRDNISQRELDSIFWFNLLIGFVIFLFVNIFAKLIANIYDNIELINYIRILSIIFLITPLDLIFRAILEKSLEFNKVELGNILKTITLLLFTVILEYLNFQIVGYILAMILSGIISLVYFMLIFLKNKIWFPSFRFNLNDMKLHISFGFYVTAKSFLNYIGRNFDELIVGKVLGLEVLGLYYFAKNIISKPALLLSSSFSKIAFPLYSKLKEDHCKLKKIYLKLTQTVSLLGFFIFGLIIVIIPYIVNVFFASEWNNSIVLIRIFSVIAFLDLLSAGFASAMLYTLREPKFVFLIDLYLTPIRLIIIYMASLISIELVCLSFLGIVFIKTVILQLKVNQKLNFSSWEYISVVFMSLRIVIITFIISFFFLYFISSFNVWFKLISLGCMFSFTYLSLTYVLNKKELYEIKKVLFKK